VNFEESAVRRVKEAVTEKKLVAWAEAHGVLSIKLNILGRRGWPDRLFFLPGGRPYFVEVKALGEKPRPLQVHVIKQLTNLGYSVEVHDTFELAIEFMKWQLSLWNRFWIKVKKAGPDDCWLWTGTKGRGYGQINFGPRGLGGISAHRLSWMFFNGPITEEVIMHTCNNKLCVNPKHLKAGTQSENTKDSYKSGLQKGMIGTDNPNAKLTSAKVERLRGPLKRGELKALAEELGITYGSAKTIRSNNSWNR
jgi:hypothetical protein